MKPAKSILFLAAVVLSAISCQRNVSQQPDPRVQKLEQEVRRLNEENQKLEDQIQDLQTRMQTHIDVQTMPSIPEKEKKSQMTVQILKQQIAPALKEAISKSKKQLETPKRGSQFGMRMEYDLPAAVYGLITTGDPEIPYRAKVIVKFEKFLESEKKSDSYGSGSTTFLFALRKNRWVLESQQ
jgi:TolA-binding protein